MIRAAAVALGCALLLSCSSVADEASNPTPSVATSDPAGTPTDRGTVAGDPARDRMPTSADEVRRTARGEEPRAGGRAPSRDTMPLTLELDRGCARPGTPMSATATTLRRSKLAFAASYSDNDFVPNFTYVPGEGNPTGTFTWTWEISPTTPEGEALVTVVAANSTEGRSRGASEEASFRIAADC